MEAVYLKDIETPDISDYSKQASRITITCNRVRNGNAGFQIVILRGRRSFHFLNSIVSQGMLDFLFVFSNLYYRLFNPFHATDVF